MPESSVDAEQTKATVVQPNEDHTLAIVRPQAMAQSPAMPDVSAPSALSQSLGHYRLVKPLGKGGMGQVFLAEDTRLRRPVAVKVMHAQYAVNSEARERFLREARAAAAVRHHNVITIYEVDEVADVPFIVMEFLRGISLDGYLEKKGLPSFEQVLRLGREMAAGLAAAHDQGLVHRDIKPANVWLEVPRGHVKLLDFGLARLDREQTILTGVGEVMGTPAYMAPEQARGERVDHRADLYSLGAVLYALCTGRPPFTGQTVMAVLTALAVDRPTPVRALNPAIPSSLAEIIERLLAKRPDQRPGSTREVMQALRNVEYSPNAQEDDAAISVAPTNVDSDPSPTMRGQDRTELDKTERIADPAPAPKRRRRRKAARPSSWQRTIGWLIGGLTLIVACIIGIDIASRSRPTTSEQTSAPESPAAEKPALTPAKNPAAVPKAEAQVPVQAEVVEPDERPRPDPKELFPPPPPKKDFPPPPKKDFPPPPKKGFN